MKNLVYMFLLVGSLLIGANAVNAAADGSKKHKAKMKYVSCSDQTSQIKSLIGNPDLSLKNEVSSVEVNFNISDDNVISVNNINSDNAELKEYVFKKLDGKAIRGNEVELKNQTLTLVFKAEKAKIYSIY
jgi:hypothetical protein